MAASNFPICLPIILKYEGGYSSIRSDPGNWTGGKVGSGVLKGTKYGIAASSHPSLDIKNLTVDQAGAIYRKEYWNPLAGDALTPGVDLVSFDYAVNSGVSRAAKALQRAVGIKQTGVIDTGTVKAVLATSGVAIVKAVCGYRLSFLQSLKTWKTFGKGWKARVGDVLARGLTMATGSTAAAKAHVAKLETAATTDSTRAKSATGAGVVTGGGGVTADHTVGMDWSVLIGIGIVAAVLIVAAVILARRAAIAREVAAAADATIHELEAAGTPAS